ncbi:hypothetical protein NDU88_005432 [Pleurodeles waltl]|uniref:Uncharacterized protein n=1 Tax=Pleurodeles waltl TaxID=8319 RepID=A0AAV7QL56_PLEWA|nr:hypothetical protein NDU88_005432 [Pleurodeles waltl]
MPDPSTVLAAGGSVVLIVPSHPSPFLGLHSVQDVPMAGYPVSPPLSGLRVCPVSYAAHLFASDATAVLHAPGRCHGVPLGRLRATAQILSDPDDLERPYAAPEARRRRPGGCRRTHLESNAGSHSSQIAAPAHTRGAAQPSPAPRLGSCLHISMSYAAHLFASDATGVAAAVLSGPQPLGRRHHASSPGPIHTSNLAYVGPYWCVQRRCPVLRAPGWHHGVPLGRLRATARIRSDLDGLDRPVAAPEARRRQPR